MLKYAPQIILVDALLVLIGGIMGHVKASSTASLVSGIVFGALLLFCSIALFLRRRIGAYGALLVNLVLTAFFAYRFCLTLKVLPSGLMALISLCVTIYLFLFKSKLKSKS